MNNLAISSTAKDAPAVDISHNLHAVRRYLKMRDLVPELKVLERPASWLLSSLIVVDWMAILAAMAAPIFLSPWLLPLSLIVIASRQRALGIFIHDASHRHITRNVFLNDLVGRYLLALPLFEDLAGYRKLHVDHHRNLGHRSTDPDYVDPKWFAHIDPSSSGAAMRIYLTLLKKKIMAGVQVRFDALCWWFVVTVMLSVFVGLHQALGMVCIWVLAYLTVYKAITTFTELSDHTYGVDQELTYTRTIPSSLLVSICYPHNDRFHLTHHLLPAVPTPRLSQAHQLLMGMKEYANSHICASLSDLMSEWTKLLPKSSHAHTAAFPRPAGLALDSSAA